MRILYVGNSETHSTARFYAKAFSSLGHETISWDPRFFSAATPIEKLLMRLKRGPLLRSVFSANHELKQLSKRKFDLVFVMGENFFTPETILTLRRRSGAVIYHSHDNVFSSGILKSEAFFSTLALYSAVFTTKSQNVARYEKLGQKHSFFIPSTYEPSVHRPLTQAKDLDVAFVGTFARSRLRYIDAVDGVQLCGNGWSSVQPNAPESIYEDSYANVLSRSKIALGLLREEARDRHSQRTFEIPACATLQLAPRNEEILSYFQEDKEIVCFESPEELRSKVDFLLSHDSIREKIANAGYERVVNGRHTYRDRCEAILHSFN